MPGQVDAGPTAEEVQALRGLARNFGVSLLVGDQQLGDNWLAATDAEIDGDARVQRFLDSF